MQVPCPRPGRKFAECSGAGTCTRVSGLQAQAREIGLEADTDSAACVGTHEGLCNSLEFMYQENVSPSAILFVAYQCAHTMHMPQDLVQGGLEQCICSPGLTGRACGIPVTELTSSWLPIRAPSQTWTYYNVTVSSAGVGGEHLVAWTNGVQEGSGVARDVDRDVQMVCQVHLGSCRLRQRSARARLPASQVWHSCQSAHFPVMSLLSDTLC